MPTYAYACTTCDHRFEAQQSFADDALTECPECAGRLRKLFNSVGIVFKGSGFYRTDSRASSSTSGKGSDSKGENGAKSAASSQSSSKDAGSNGSGANGSGSNGSAPNGGGSKRDKAPSGSTSAAKSKAPAAAGSAA